MIGLLRWPLTSRARETYNVKRNG